MSSHGPPTQTRKQPAFVRITGSFSSAQRRLRKSHIAWPSSIGAQSGPRQRNRWRVARSSPAAAKPSSVVAYLAMLRFEGINEVDAGALEIAFVICDDCQR